MWAGKIVDSARGEDKNGIGNNSIWGRYRHLIPLHSLKQSRHGCLLLWVVPGEEANEDIRVEMGIGHQLLCLAAELAQVFLRPLIRHDLLDFPP